MDKIPRLFIITGLIYLCVSSILGLLITIGPGYSFMHSHLALIGWVSFFIFGFIYDIIPRFSGKELFSEKLGKVHFWLGNIGLIGLSLSYPYMRMYMLKSYNYSDLLIIVLAFGTLLVISIFIFSYNIWKTLEK